MKEKVIAKLAVTASTQTMMDKRSTTQAVAEEAVTPQVLPTNKRHLQDFTEELTKLPIKLTIDF